MSRTSHLCGGGRLAFLLALGGAFAPICSTAHARSKPAGPRELEPTDKVEGGDHWRLLIGGHPVHVWRPAGYVAAKAGTVLYVHGYWTNVDGAWGEQRLASQFRASHQDALFIVPEAPENAEQEVRYTGLNDLLTEVSGKLHFAVPRGVVLAFGHSGAYRTLAAWTSYPRLSQLFLLDAMYGNQDQFAAWLGASRGHRMVLVGHDTWRETVKFVKRMKGGVKGDKVPESWEGFSKRQRVGQLLYLKSQNGHAAIVSEGNVLPVLLRLTPLKKI